ncbi:hypothetical protein QQ045_031894 [Rhodiola kirilowii]
MTLNLLDFASGRKSGEALMSNNENESPPIPDNAVDHATLQKMHLYSFNQLETATRNFDAANKLGQGGFGGYMSPEYAMGGRFSEKSDVFSFGVMLLEIVSGRRNTSFSQNDSALSLLGHAWNLWNEGRTEALIDPALSNSSGQLQEILRCVHIGLLCVQELVSDRPSISTVLSMLTSEILNLPRLNQLAFATAHSSAISANGFHVANRFSVNNVTVTDVQGR